jgi:hypothetical protein
MECQRQKTHPLVTSACHGHSKIIKVLLEAGARQPIDGIRIPLVVAMVARHEPVALLLSQRLHASVVPLGKSAGTVLQIATDSFRSQIATLGKALSQ